MGPEWLLCLGIENPNNCIFITLNYQLKVLEYYLAIAYSNQSFMLIELFFKLSVNLKYGLYITELT